MDNLYLYLLPYFFSLAITVSVTVITYLRRNVLGARSFSFFLLMESIWTMGYILELSSPTLAGKMFWDNLQWAPALLTGVSSLAFSLEYTGKMSSKAMRWLASAAGVTILFILTIWLDNGSSLVLTNPRLVEVAPFPIYTYSFGPVELAGSLFSYLMLSLGVYWLVKEYSSQKSVFRFQTGIILLGLLLPLAGSFLSVFNVVILPNRDISPFTFAAANVLISIGLFRYRIFDLVPLARSSVMDYISDPVIVLDAFENVLDLNPALEALVGLSKNEIVNKPVHKLIPGLPGIAHLNMMDEIGEYCFQSNTGPVYFEINSKVFTGQIGSYSGRILIFHNITRHKQDEDELRSNNSVLEKRVYQRALDLEAANRRLLEENKIRKQVEQEKSRYASEMEILYRLALELTDLPNDTKLDEFFASRLKDLTHAYIVTISEYDPQLRELHPRQMILDNETINKGLKILGIDPRKQVFPISQEAYEEITRHVVDFKDSLSDITFGVIPKVIADRVEDFFNLAHFAGLAVIDQGELRATMVLAFQKSVPYPNEGFLRAISHLAAIAYRRRKAEQDRQESDTRFQQMAELLPQVVFECGLSGEIKYVNQRAIAMFGYGRLEADMNFISFVASEQRKIAQENYQKILEGQLPRQHEYLMERKDGSQFPVLIYSTAILKDEKVTGLRGVIVDISDLKIAENDLKRTNRSLRVTSRANQALVHASGMQILYDEICRSIVEEGDYNYAWISLVEKDQPNLVKIAAFAGGQGGPAITGCAHCPDSLSQCQPVFKAIASQEIVVVRDISCDSGCLEFLAEPPQDVTFSLVSLPMSYEGQQYGVITVYSDAPDRFDADEIKVLSEMASDLSFGIHTILLRGQLAEAYQATLEGLVRALELREKETADHSQRVVQMTSVMARKIGLEPKVVDQMERGALLHDIGKLGIPDRVLLKESTLSEDEWVVMRGHSELAFQIISPVAFLKSALEIPHYHHERWDGSGYPFGLKGEEIPLSARIFAVVDVWDALTHSRRYRSEWPKAAASQYLRDNSGIQFDPRMVELFLELQENGDFDTALAQTWGRTEVPIG